MKKKDRIKVPKRVMGVKVPKESRRNLNTILKNVPASTAKPLLTAAVGTLVAAIFARLEGPLGELVDRQKSKSGEASVLRH